LRSAPEESEKETMFPAKFNTGSAFGRRRPLFSDLSLFFCDQKIGEWKVLHFVTIQEIQIRKT